MKYVIIGNSAAGIGAVEGIRQTDKTGEIIIISDEPHHTYSRPLISYMLLGKVTEQTIKYRPDDFYEKNNCTFINAKAVEIDAGDKYVILSDGSKVAFDKLLLATGSSAFVPDFKGLDSVENKHTFMSLNDAHGIDKAVAAGSKVLIIGAGLIGLKCAEGLLKRKAELTIVDLAPIVLSSILDERGAKLVQSHLSDCVNFKLSTVVECFKNNTAVLTGDEEITFDTLVLAVGVRPNTALLNGIAEIDKGIIINGKSETTVPDIYAAGDCTQTVDISSGMKKIMALLPNAYIQGECAGINMAGGDKSFDKAIPMNAVGFNGLHIITAGSYTGEDYTEESDGNYKRLFYSDNKLNGYIMIGNTDKAGIYTALIRERKPLDTIDFELICNKPGLMAFTKKDREVMLGGIAG